VHYHNKTGCLLSSLCRCHLAPGDYDKGLQFYFQGLQASARDEDSEDSFNL
jgi:hypothetical protein